MPSIFKQSDLFNRAKNFPSALLDPLRAHVSGPQANLHRFAVAAEKPGIALGAYNPAINAGYAYPGQALGSVIDVGYVKLYMDSARINYFTNLISGADTIAPVASQPNQIKVTAGSTVFKANGVNYPRSGDLKADVQVGDAVYIRGVVSSHSIVFNTYVQGFIADAVASIVGTAVADANNTATQSASTSFSQTAGTVTCAVITSVSGANYNGLPSGNITETYNVAVTTGSVGGDATTAVLQVTSASGNDNQVSVIPAAFSSPTSIGTRGLTATFVNTAGGCSGSDLVVGQIWSITVHQVFTEPTGGAAAGTYIGNTDATYIAKVSLGGKLDPVQTVANPTTAPTVNTANSGGTVPDNTYYIAITEIGGTSGETMVSSAATQVTAGGGFSTITITSPAAANGSLQYNVYAGTIPGTLHKQGSGTNYGTPVVLTTYSAGGAAPPGSNTALGVQPNPTPPQITVTTTTGVDISGPTPLLVTGSGVTWTNASVVIGTNGITWTPNAAAYNKGDIYRIPATAAAKGAYKTLVLSQNLPTTPYDLTTATTLDLKLYSKADGLLISQNRIESPPNTNYSANSTQITVNAGITAGDSRWTDGSKYPVTSGNLYVEYREWIADSADNVYTIVDPKTVATVLGPVTPDNPLAYGVFKALQNSNGRPVAYTGVTDPSSLSAWNEVLSLVDTVDAIYNMAPTTYDPAVLASYVAHVDAQSAPEIGAYRNVFIPLQAVTNKVVVNATKTADHGTALATLIANPSIVATQYTYLQVTAGNAHFVTNGVAAGDVVRYLYTTDGFGGASWTEFLVAAVINEDTLLLAAANSVAVNTAQKVEVWHNNTKEEIKTALIAAAAGYADKRVRAYWPDSITDGSTVASGYFGGCILAGLTSAVPPHQGVTNVELLGLTDVPRTNSFFSNSQRIALAAAGVWVIEKDEVSGAIFTRRATTTDLSNTKVTEEMMVRDVDGVVFAILKQLSNYIGEANVVQSTLSQMTADIGSLRSYLLQSTFVDRLGSMLIDLVITDIHQHVTLLDRVVIVFTLTINYPVNKIVLTVVI